MATAMAWLDSKDLAATPEFFESAIAVELPELRWEDVETVDIQTPVEHTEPQPEPVDPAKEAADREQRIENAQRLFDKTKYDSRLRWYKAQDRRMDAELASGKVQYLDRHKICFHKIVAQYVNFLHRSEMKVQKYSDAGSGKKSLASRIDFMADVEITAKRALRDAPKLLRVLLNHMENEFCTWEEVRADIRVQIEHKLGWWFIRAGLYPQDRYFS